MKKFMLMMLILITAGQLQNIYADEVFNRLQSGGKNVVYLSPGMDPVFTVGVGYARSFEIKAINRILTLTGDIAFPIFLMDFRHYKIDIGSRIAFFNTRFNVLNRLSIMDKGTDNPVYTGNLISIEEGLLFGFFSPRWYAAGEIDYEKFLFTHIKHTSWYKEYVHSDAKDGWYSSTGGLFTFGLQGGYTFRETVEVTLRAGMYWTEAFNSPAGAPFIANIGVNYHF